MTRKIDDFIGEIVDARSGNLVVFTVDNDFMSPTLKIGDKLIIDPNHLLPSPPGIYALWDGFSVIIRRLEYLAGKQPCVRVYCDNERCGPYRECTPDEIMVIGRVLERCTTIF